MTAGLSALVLALVGGCGDDDPAPEREPPLEAPQPEDDAEEDDAGELSDPAQRLLEACRRIAEETPGVPDEVRRDVIEECERAAEDDEEALRRAAGAACDVVAAATVPWPLRGPAAHACRRAIPGVDP